MHPDHIQALIARCLTEPDVLPALPDDANGLDAASLQRIALFRGFIVKVKHNQVRKILPLTLRMLPAVGLELAFFSTYAPAYLAMRSSGPMPLDRQTTQFALDLQRFLDGQSGVMRDAVNDVLTHELKLWSLRSESEAHEPSGVRPGGAGRLSWRGRLELQRYGTSVLSACGALSVRRFDPDRHVKAEACTIAYWRAIDGDGVEFFEVDELTALLMSMAQRQRTITGVRRALTAIGVSQISRRDLEDFFRQLAERGFLQCA
jgi:hypothetical protein